MVFKDKLNTNYIVISSTSNIYAGQTITLKDSYQNYRTLIFVLNGKSSVGSRFSSQTHSTAFMDSFINNSSCRFTLTNYWNQEYYISVNVHFSDNKTLVIDEITGSSNITSTGWLYILAIK